MSIISQNCPKELQLSKRAKIDQKSQNEKKNRQNTRFCKKINVLTGGGPQGHRGQQGGGPQGYRGQQGGGPQGGHRGQPGGGHRGHQGGHQEHRGHQEALSSIASTLNQMNLNTNQAPHDRPPPGTREGPGGPPQVLPPAVIPATAINPQAAAAVAALAASNDTGSAPPGGLEQHYQAYNGTPTGWAAPPPRHPQWQEPEPQQQQQQPPPTLLSSPTTSSIQVQAVSYSFSRLFQIKCFSKIGIHDILPR